MLSELTQAESLDDVATVADTTISKAGNIVVLAAVVRDVVDSGSCKSKRKRKGEDTYKWCVSEWVVIDGSARNSA